MAKLSLKARKERAKYVLKEMDKLFPEAKSELENWETPFQFLICILLSAQTTDAMVNNVTGELFEKYPDAATMSKADPEDVLPIIRRVNYNRNKSKFVVGTAKIVAEKYGGEPPKTIDELIELPGIGVKTANVFLNDLYKANTGIGVDTHVLRVSNRLGLSDGNTPEKVAADLQKIYPQEDWHRVNSLFVLYGRYICKARVKPEKSECVFEFCEWCRG